MAKQGQHPGDHAGRQESTGNNNPSKSVTVTAGNVKKKETYDEQARNHQDTGKQAQAAKNEPKYDEAEIGDNGALRARDSDVGGGRNGSQSNASR